jgi:uncharacterized protein (UPF0262 family)
LKIPKASLFASQKLLAVVSKTNKGNDIRKTITMSLLKQIIEALPNICSSYFEATLFASIFQCSEMGKGFFFSIFFEICKVYFLPY